MFNAENLRAQIGRVNFIETSFGLGITIGVVFTNVLIYGTISNSQKRRFGGHFKV